MPRKAIFLATAILALSPLPAFAADNAPAKASVPAKETPPPPLQPYFPAEITIQKIIDERLVTNHDSIGLVIGIIDQTGVKIIASGHYDEDGDPKVDGKTLFEIGSVTKIFTALLLTDMARRGEVKLDDPVAKYLPPDVKLPQRNGRLITLLDLATHTSGLPKGWPVLPPENEADRASDTSIKQIYRFLATYQASRDIGSTYEYSDLGYALLGEALSRRAGADFETLVETRIGKPLGITDTVITVTGELADRYQPAALCRSGPPR